MADDMALSTDTDWARALEALRIEPSAFTHERHLQVAFAYLQALPTVEAATARMRTAVQRFAHAAGQQRKYHETLTVFWMQTVAAARAASPEANTWADLKQVHPELLDRQAPLAVYTPERLFGDEARARWCAPDRRDVEVIQ
jgi:hypothetical protein